MFNFAFSLLGGGGGGRRKGEMLRSDMCLCVASSSLVIVRGGVCKGLLGWGGDRDGVDDPCSFVPVLFFFVVRFL